MPILKQWNIETFANRIYLSGIVYGHTSYSCASGRMIHTSDIKSVEYSDTVPDVLIVHTRNTLYTLKLQDHQYVCYYKEPKMAFFSPVDPCAAITDYVYRQFNELSKKFNCPDLSERVITHAQKAEQDHLNFVKECNKLLSDRMLMVELDSEEYNFQYRCAYKDSNGIVTSDASTPYKLYSEFTGENTESIAVFSPCGLNIEHFKYGHIFFSLTKNYFASNKNNHEPTCEEGHLLGYIRNAGKMPMFVKFSWEKNMIIEANETVPVYYKKTGCTEDDFNEKYGDNYNLYQPIPQQDMFSDFSIGGAWIP